MLVHSNAGLFLYKINLTLLQTGTVAQMQKHHTRNFMLSAVGGRPPLLLWTPWTLTT